MIMDRFVHLGQFGSYGVKKKYWLFFMQKILPLSIFEKMGNAGVSLEYHSLFHCFICLCFFKVGFSDRIHLDD